MRYLIALLLPLLLFAAPDAKMKISKNVDNRLKVAIVDCSSDNEMSKKLFDIFVDDFRISGNFLPDRNRYEGSYSSAASAVGLRNKQYILKYEYANYNSSAVVRFKLIKGSNSRIVLEKKYTIPNPSRYPFLAHRAVTEVNRVLGFPSIKWINRYVVFARYTGRKESEIVLADYTFHFTKTVIRGGLNLFPQWGDPKQQGFYYTSYEGKEPAIYHLNIYTGERKFITSSPGMIICSDVSKDGTKLLLTMAPNAQPDIYELDLSAGSKRRLTKYSGIDVNGKFADNGKSLIFVSNRLGNPGIYKKKIGSSAVIKLIYHGKKNSSCDTNGKKVVYSSKEATNRFNIYVADSYGGGVRPLTSTGVNQFPRFAPDGNTVLYIKRDRGLNEIGYIGLKTNITMLFPLGNRKIQSIDW